MTTPIHFYRALLVDHNDTREVFIQDDDEAELKEYLPSGCEWDAVEFDQFPTIRVFRSGFVYLLVQYTSSHKHHLMHLAKKKWTLKNCTANLVGCL